MPNQFPDLFPQGSLGISAYLPGFVGPPGPPGPPGNAAGGIGIPERINSANAVSFDFYTSTVKIVSLSSTVNSSTATRASDGLEVTILVHNLNGGHGFIFPANFYNAPAISTANANNLAGTTVVSKWIYDASAQIFFPTTPLIY